MEFLKLIKQKPDSRTCGQCCVATLIRKSEWFCINLFGHDHSTYTREVVKVLNDLGINNSQKLLRLSKTRTYSDICIISCTWFNESNKRKKHWVLKVHEWVYDPSIGIYHINGINEIYETASFLEIDNEVLNLDIKA